MPSSLRLISLVALLALTSCNSSPPPPPFELQPLTLPAESPATGPRLSGNSETGLMLSWMEQRDNATALKYSRFRDGAWSDQASIVSIDGMFVNWADLPSVVPLPSGRLAAHWLQLSGSSPYGYDVIVRTSTDDGASWSNLVTPHTDGTDTEHGFVSMFEYETRLGLVWLDGRKYVNEVTDDPIASGMTLRATFVDEQQKLQGEQLVDNLICDCCQTDVAVADAGPIAVYRDRTINEIRDIAVTRFIDGRWSEGQIINNDEWRISGCPVNGPAIAAQGGLVAVAWFSAANNSPTIRLAMSKNSGKTFAEPLTVIDGGILGHVDIALLDDGDVAVSWIRVSDGGIGEVQVRKMRRDGSPGPVHSIGFGASSFSVPQMGRAGENLVFAWTESKDFVDRIESAKVAVAALDSATNAVQR